MGYALLFVAGALLCNGIPHLVAGLQGATFPTPFGKPRGVGHSSALTNLLWGAANMLIGARILAAHPVTVGGSPGFLALIAGAMGIGCYLALHFAKVRTRG